MASILLSHKIHWITRTITFHFLWQHNWQQSTRIWPRVSMSMQCGFHFIVRINSPQSYRLLPLWKSLWASSQIVVGELTITFVTLERPFNTVSGHLIRHRGSTAKWPHDQKISWSLSWILFKHDTLNETFPSQPPIQCTHIAYSIALCSLFEIIFIHFAYESILVNAFRWLWNTSA